MSKDGSLLHNVDIIASRRFVYTDRDKSGISVTNICKEFYLAFTYLHLKINYSTSINAAIKTNKKVQDKCFYFMLLKM